MHISLFSHPSRLPVNLFYAACHDACSIHWSRSTRRTLRFWPCVLELRLQGFQSKIVFAISVLGVHFSILECVFGVIFLCVFFLLSCGFGVAVFFAHRHFWGWRKIFRVRFCNWGLGRFCLCGVQVRNHYCYGVLGCSFFWRSPPLKPLFLEGFSGVIVLGEKTDFRNNCCLSARNPYFCSGFGSSPSWGGGRKCRRPLLTEKKVDKSQHMLKKQEENRRRGKTKRGGIVFLYKI